MSEVAPEIKAEEGGQRPEWLPEQFQSPEALAKSYDESRKEMDRLRSQLDQERAQFSEALERIEAVQPPVQQQQGNQPDFIAAYAQAVESGDNATALAIQLQLQQQLVSSAIDERFKQLEPKLEGQSKADREIAFRMAEDRLTREFGDGWDKVAPGVDKLLKERPHWTPAENSVDGWVSVMREAAQLVQAEQIVAEQAAADRDRSAKLSARTAESSGVSRFPIATDEKKAEWDAVKNATTGGFSEIARKG